MFCSLSLLGTLDSAFSIIKWRITEVYNTTKEFRVQFKADFLAVEIKNSIHFTPISSQCDI